MVGRHKRRLWKAVDRAVRERHALLPENPVRVIPRDPAQAEDRTPPSRLQKPKKPRRAVRDLLPGRQIRGRGTVGGGGDKGTFKRKPISGIEALRLGGDARTVERGEKKIPAPVAGEHPSRAVRAVRRRRETEDETVGLRITEVRHGAAPVRLFPERRPLFPRDPFSPFDETGATAAIDEFVVEKKDRFHRRRMGMCRSTSTSRRDTIA